MYYYLVFYTFLSLNLIKNKFLAFIAFVFPVAFFAALRGPEVDKDYKNYYYLWFVEVKDFAYYLLEGSSKFIFTFAKSFGFEFHYVLLFFSLTSLIFKFIAISKLNLNLYIAFSIYIGFFFFQHEMTQVRLAVALSIVLLSFSFFIQKKILLSFILLLLAVTFHSSVVILSLFYFFSRKKLLLPFLLILFPVLALLSSLGFNISNLILSVIKFIPLLGKYVFYFQGGWHEQNINIFSMTNISFYLLAFWSVIEIFNREKVTDIHLYSTKLVLIGLVCIPLLSSLPVAAFRISQIFLFFIPLMVASLYGLYWGRLYRFLFISLSLVYSCLLYYAVVESSKILNDYTSIFNDSLY